jgi:hypothetical protein
MSRCYNEHTTIRNIFKHIDKISKSTHSVRKSFYYLLYDEEELICDTNYEEFEFAYWITVFHDVVKLPEGIWEQKY